MKGFLGWCLRWGGLLPPAWLTYHALLGLLHPQAAIALNHPLLRGLAILGSGILARWVLAKAFTQDPLEFLDTLEHELTHALFGYLTGHPPISLKATLRKGGNVVLGGRNPFIVLSPYTVPLFASIAALALPLLSAEARDLGRWLWPALLGSYLFRWFREMHPGQSDFAEYGMVFSFLFIAFWLPLLLLGLLVWTGWLGDSFVASVQTEILRSFEGIRHGWGWRALLRRSLDIPSP